MCVLWDCYRWSFVVCRFIKWKYYKFLVQIFWEAAAHSNLDSRIFCVLLWIQYRLSYMGRLDIMRICWTCICLCLYFVRSPFSLLFALYFLLSQFNKQYKLLLFARKTRYKLPLKHIYMSRAHKPKNCSVFYWFNAYDGIVVVLLNWIEYEVNMCAQNEKKKCNLVFRLHNNFLI